jgi:periplasmic protein CpxP/Spy
MKSNRWKFITAAIAVAVLGAAAALSATAGHGHWHGRGDAMFGGPGMGFMGHYLNLTDDQKAQVKQIMQKEKPTFQPLMQQLRQSREQERQIAEASTFDESAARALATQRAQVMTDLTVQRLRVESELYQVLTPDQKTKLNDFLDKRAQRFQQHQQQPQSQDQAPSNQ